MLDEVRKSLETSPIVKKGEYNYFINPISDGIPSMKPSMLRELTDIIIKHVNLDIDKIVATLSYLLRIGRQGYPLIPIPVQRAGTKYHDPQ